MKTLFKNLAAIAFFALPLCLSGQSPLNNFIMFWEFTNADGSNPRDHEDICQCGTVYIKNRSTYNSPSAVSIGPYLTTGEYTITRWSDNAQVASIPAANWLGNQVIAVTVPCSLSFDYAGGINFRITHYGTGVIPYSSVSRHHTRSLKTYTLPVSAGPDPSPVCPYYSVTLNGSPTSGTSLVWTPGGSTNPNITIFPSTSTTYTLTGTKNYNGYWSNSWTQTHFTCTATDQVFVEVKPAPSIHVDNYSLCTNDPMPVLDGGPLPVAYLWTYTATGSSTPVTVGNTRYLNTGSFGYGVYELTVTGANGCSTTGTFQVLLSPSAATNIDASFTFSTFNTGTTTTISASSTETGTHWWGIFSSDEDCTNPLYPIQPPTTGPASVTFGVLPLNQYYKIIHKLKRKPCGEWVEDSRCTWETKIFGIGVSPNPTTETFTLSIENYNTEKIYTVFIYDRMGLLMDSFDMRTNEVIKDISSYQPGIYTIIMSDGNDTEAERIMKN